jgi:outer membrane protein OmpA-like peptidoglycan-associated protein
LRSAPLALGVLEEKMADVILAEWNGRVWLVGGEKYLDDLLANTLAQEVSVEFVACATQAEVNSLWVQHCGTPSVPGTPWQINPIMLSRIRSRSPGFQVFFGNWSAFLDPDALTVINAAAAWAKENGEAPVVLAEYIDPSGPQAIVDLSRLRAGLIADKLVEGGIDRKRIERTTRELAEIGGGAGDNQRVDIIVRMAERQPAVPGPE